MKENIIKVYERASNFLFKEFRDELKIIVPKAEILEFLNIMKSDLNFNFLVDLSGADYLDYSEAADERFTVVYHLLSIEKRYRLVVGCWISEEDLEIDSIIEIYATANWQEREVFDLYGIKFKGHPDLRRILNPNSFEHYPLRKDYPVNGLGERGAFKVVERKVGSKFNK